MGKPQIYYTAVSKGNVLKAEAIIAKYYRIGQVPIISRRLLSSLEADTRYLRVLCGDERLCFEIFRLGHWRLICFRDIDFDPSVATCFAEDALDRCVRACAWGELQVEVSVPEQDKYDVDVAGGNEEHPHRSKEESELTAILKFDLNYFNNNENAKIVAVQMAQSLPVPDIIEMESVLDSSTLTVEEAGFSKMDEEADFFYNVHEEKVGWFTARNAMIVIVMIAIVIGVALLAAFYYCDTTQCWKNTPLEKWGVVAFVENFL